MIPFVSWHAFARNLWGESWAVCRDTPRNREKHGKCITHITYLKAREQWLFEQVQHLTGELGKAKAETTDERVLFLVENNKSLSKDVAEKQRQIEELELDIKGLENENDCLRKENQDATLPYYQLFEDLNPVVPLIAMRSRWTNDQELIVLCERLETDLDKNL